MNIATATMSIDEPIRVAPLIYARAAGRYGLLFIYLLLGTFAGVVCGSLLAVLLPLLLTLAGVPISPVLLPLLTGTIEVASGIAGLWLGSSYANGQYTKRYVAALIDRGAPSESIVVFELTDAGVTISDSCMTTLVRWHALLEIVPAPEHWILITGPSSFLLPKRAFSTEQDERDYLASMLGRMMPGARNRSAEANLLFGPTAQST
jgi:hypothetical protein